MMIRTNQQCQFPKSNFGLLLFVLLFSFGTHAQYQRFSVGMTVGTGRFSPEFFQSGFTAQFNTKRFFSFESQLLIQQSKWGFVNDFANVMPTHRDFTNASSSSVSIPLVGKMSFGLKRYFFLSAGLSFTHHFPITYSTHVTHNHDFSGKPDYDEFGSVPPNQSCQMNFLYGAGCAIPFGKRFLFTMEARASGLSAKLPTAVSDLNDFKGYTRLQLNAGIAIQLNREKDSTYHFETVGIRLKRKESDTITN